MHSNALRNQIAINLRQPLSEFGRSFVSPGRRRV